MPLHNWIKCNDGDFTFTRKGTKGSKEKDYEAWVVVHDEYLKEYGLGKMYKRMLNQMKKKAQLELDYVLTENRFKLTLIEMEEQKLKSMLNTAGTGISIDQSLIHLSKWLGYWIKSKEINVKEFFNLTKEYERLNKLEHGKKD
jgi:hypothetical protein